MKTLFAALACASLFVFPAELPAQSAADSDSTGTPGDNFSLEGALAMFQRAASPEEFEKLINTKDNGVNNLDLDGDGNIDYVRVIDRSEKEMHAIVLQVPVSETESQDIAVIELEKTGPEKAVVQIVGDQDIYGEERIAEPQEEDAQSPGGSDADPGGHGPYVDAGGPVRTAVIVVNVWPWPCVRFVFAPAYVVWTSPWAWHRYPAWWHPWRPLGWRAFHPLAYRYRRHVAFVHVHRVVRVHRYYAPHRMTSVTVRTRHPVERRYRVRGPEVRQRPAVRSHREAPRAAPRSTPRNEPRSRGRRR